MKDVRGGGAGDMRPILDWRLISANPRPGCQGSNAALPLRLAAKPPVTFMPQAVDSHSEVG